MTPAQIKRIRKKLGLTQEKMAQKVGCSVRTIARWETGEQPPSSMALSILQTFDSTKKPELTGK